MDFMHVPPYISLAPTRTVPHGGRATYIEGGAVHSEDLEATHCDNLDGSSATCGSNGRSPTGTKCCITPGYGKSDGGVVLPWRATILLP